MFLAPTSIIRHRLALVALLSILAAGAVLAEPAPAPPAIKVSVVVILASEGEKGVDERLGAIAEEVQRVNTKLTRFEMVKTSCKSIKVGGKDVFDLVGGQKVSITVESRDEEGRVQLKVVPPLLGEITYATTCGKFLPIVTRYRTPRDELLILAIRVQPCAGKK
jgi:hypothetical protein